MSSFIKKISNRFDKQKTFVFNELDVFAEQQNWISSGSPWLDYNLKTLGFPTGIVELRGDSQSGKTTISLHALGQAVLQYKERAVVVILSSERRDNKIYAEKMGIDVDSIIIHRIRTIEDAGNKIHQTITASYEALEEHLIEQILDENPKWKKGGDNTKTALKEAKIEFGKLRFLFVWDSIGQTVSKSERSKAEANAESGEEGQAAMASAARALGNVFRNVISLMDEEEITLFCINRAYENITLTGQKLGNKSYGGKAIEFFPNMRIELTRVESLRVGDKEEVGQISELNPFKTDYNKPKQKFRIEIAYGIGFVLCKGDIELGVEAGFLKTVGYGAEFINDKGKTLLKWTSRKELYELYEKRNPMLKVLIKKLSDYAHDKVLQEREEAKESVKR